MIADISLLFRGDLLWKGNLKIRFETYVLWINEKNNYSLNEIKNLKLNVGCVLQENLEFWKYWKGLQALQLKNTKKSPVQEKTYFPEPLKQVSEFFTYIHLSSENSCENSKLSQSLLQKQPIKVMHFNIFS